MAKGMELAKAYVQIVPSADGIKDAIRDILGKEVEPAGTKAGQSIASKIKSVIVSAGIGTALSKTIMEGANLQQSIGGIETLFKNSADKMKQYANGAYKTAGISANDYMEQATSFSASLLSSLGGDTAKAADAANQAIIDMADNSNKMGTSLENIQNAYQGFAKQNFTMLDNLKLGYGGTKTEMERLLKDAQELSGVEYNIDNLNDVYSAIHVIQENLGITGTTSKEAAETLTGSLMAMKSSLSNFMGNLALGEDIKPSLIALANTTGAFLFENLVPAVGNVFAALPEVIGTLITESGPVFFEQAKTMISSLVQGIETKLPELMPKALQMVATIADGIIENLPMLIDAGISLLKSLVQGIINSLPVLIVEGPRIINDFADAIYSGLWKLITAGVEMIGSLLKGIWDNRGLLLENAGEIFLAFINVFSLSNMLSLGKNLISNVKKGIESLLPNMKTAGSDILKNLVSGIKSMFTNPVDTAKTLVSNIKSVFTNIKWADIGKNIITGIVKGLTNGIGSIVNAAKNVAKNALNAAKNALDIHSPSGAFRDQVGKMIDLGLASGIEGNLKPVKDAMKILKDTTIGEITTNTSYVPEFKTSKIFNTELKGKKEEDAFMQEEIRLMKQQNELLLKILEKETGIDPDDIFNSVRKSSKEYTDRTGEPAFV